MVNQAVAQSVVLFDTFDDDSLNTSTWEAFTPLASSSVVESGGKVRLTARGALATQADIGGTYTVTGSFSMISASEHFKIAVRSDASSILSTAERTGILVAFANDGNQISIQRAESDGTITIIQQKSYALAENTTYDFTINVTSNEVQLSVDGVEQLTASTSYSTGSRVMFYSREFSGTSSDLLEVTITEPISSYAPPSKDGDYVSEFREYLDETNPETDVSANELSKDLIYHFSGDRTVPELSGYFHNLTNVGEGTYRKDRFGNINSAYTTIDYDEYIEGTAPDLVGKSFTISFWVRKLYSEGQGSWLFRIGSESANGKSLHIAIDYGGTVRFSFFFEGIDTTAPISPFEWHHVVATYNVSNSEMNIYLDNSNIGSTTSANSFTGNTYFRIGNPNLEVDDFRIYGKVLSSNEIGSLFTVSNPDSDGDRLTDYYEKVGHTDGLRIISWIDGHTNFEITPDGFRYYHIQAAAPGIPTVLDLSTVVDTTYWTPVWPGSGARTDLNDYSNSFTFGETKDFIADGAYTFSKEGRSSVVVSQSPTEANGNTLILSANDIGVPGAAWHTLQIMPTGSVKLDAGDPDSDSDGYNDGTETEYAGNPFNAAGMPTFQIWHEAADSLILRFPTKLGRSYDLESIESLLSAEPWNKVQAGIAGDGEPFKVSLPFSRTKDFFRFVEVPE